MQPIHLLATLLLLGSVYAKPPGKSTIDNTNSFSSPPRSLEHKSTHNLRVEDEDKTDHHYEGSEPSKVPLKCAPFKFPESGSLSKIGKLLSTIFYNTCELAYMIETNNGKKSHMMGKKYAEKIKNNILPLQKAADEMYKLSRKMSVRKRVTRFFSGGGELTIEDLARCIRMHVMQAIKSIGNEVESLVDMYLYHHVGKYREPKVDMLKSPEYLAFVERHATYAMNTRILTSTLRHHVRTTMSKEHQAILDRVGSDLDAIPPKDGSRGDSAESKARIGVQGELGMLQRLLLVQSAMSAIVLVDVVKGHEFQGSILKYPSVCLDISTMTPLTAWRIIYRATSSLVPQEENQVGVSTKAVAPIQTPEALRDLRAAQAKRDPPKKNWTPMVLQKEDLTLAIIFDRLTDPYKADALDWAVAAQSFTTSRKGE